jgi:hypothetical protein
MVSQTDHDGRSRTLKLLLSLLGQTRAETFARVVRNQ